MKVYSIFFLLVFNLTACNQVYRQVKNSATNKTSREISKKTNQGIEDVFNKDEETSDNTSENQTKTTTSNNTNTQSKNNPNESSTSSPTNQKRDTIKTVDSDFVAGEKIIFVDSLYGEQIGEFPSKWDLEDGTVEVMQMGETNVIGFRSSRASIFPLMDEEEYLPEKFTLEFDCYFHNKGNEGYTVKFDNGTSVRINSDGVKTKSSIRTEVASRKGWRRVAFSFNKRALKVYYEGKRLVNIPRIKKRPTNFRFSVLSFGYRNDRFAMIRNVRLAEGAVPLYERLTTDGKIVAHNIYFDTNKATLQPASYDFLDRLAAMLQAHPELKVRIEGHTDSDGTEAANQALSERRAEAVQSALVARQVGASQLTTMGFGESRPIDVNTTAEGKALNRRVEFILIK